MPTMALQSSGEHVSNSTLKYSTANTSRESIGRKDDPRCAKADLVRINRRNQRERNRVKLLNMGFERLRAVVPCKDGEQLSKIATLRGAIWYIDYLAKLLELPTSKVEGKSQSNSSRKTTSATQKPQKIKSELRERNRCSTIERRKMDGRQKHSGAKPDQIQCKRDPVDSTQLDKENVNPGRRPASPVFPGGWTDPTLMSPTKNSHPIGSNAALTTPDKNASQFSNDSGFLSWQGASPVLGSSWPTSFGRSSEGSSGYESMGSPLNLSSMMNFSSRQFDSAFTSNQPVLGGNNSVGGFPWMCQPNSIMHSVLFGAAGGVNDHQSPQISAAKRGVQQRPPLNRHVMR